MQEMLPVGAFVRRRAVPVLDAFFPSPFLPFILILFILLSFIAFPFFFVQELIRGQCLGVVTSGGSVIHKYFHRNEKAGS
jgi:hypothetical protein